MLHNMNLPLMKFYQYSNHSSIQKIKHVFNTASDINKIIKSLDTNKATGPDGITAKFVQMSANIIGRHLSSTIICDIPKNKYSKHTKTATVRSIFKKDDRAKIKNYRPVCHLNIFSKICERFLHENLRNCVNTFLSQSIFAYRKSNNTHHVLIRLIEIWKKSLCEKKLVAAVLIDLSKAFQCIPHDLPLPKCMLMDFL